MSIITKPDKIRDGAKRISIAPITANPDRFWKKVDRSGGLWACHPWTASTFHGSDYGQFADISPTTGKRTMRKAPTVAYELTHGYRVPDGEIILHAAGCTRRCCNPRHLRTGSHLENAADRVAEGKSRPRKLSDAEIATMIDLRAKGVNVNEIAALLKRCPSTVSRTLSGRNNAKRTGIVFDRRAPGRPVGATTGSSSLAALALAA